MSQVVGYEMFDADAPLAALGVQSEHVVLLAHQLSQQFAVNVTPASIFSRPSISSLAAWLSSRLKLEHSGRQSPASLSDKKQHHSAAQSTLGKHQAAAPAKAATAPASFAAQFCGKSVPSGDTDDDDDNNNKHNNNNSNSSSSSSTGGNACESGATTLAPMGMAVAPC